ncbi:hypothetical protein [Mycobacterium botniense]|uniref:Anti-sigma-M factor RsmA n=1 Tax=Mycobacterium botniense TaxID=84962 RepID=A0A7I9XVH0_9MYCO|nr:hypothetical protein [Mycobacterium botniense]GFG73776.1 hypothetical protein MBOT_11410 [Mycobacterium botniense]
MRHTESDPVEQPDRATSGTSMAEARPEDPRSNHRHDAAAAAARGSGRSYPIAAIRRALAGIAVLRCSNVSAACVPHNAVHAARPRPFPAKVLAAMAGLGALTAVVVLGTAALLRAPAPTPSTPATAQYITVSPPAIPLSEAEILALLHRTPDYGALSTPAHRASCLNGLGYATSTQVFGARPIEINGRSGVLLVLPADKPDRLAVLVVASHCNAADTQLLASTWVARPEGFTG